jgi:hypothetical protein
VRAAVFVRYHSGDELGHVAWAFEVGPGQVNVGSVENHTGHFLSPSQGDGFWTLTTTDPVLPMRRREYDDVKYIDVPLADPIRAYRVVLWIQLQGYKATFRNCEDDAYDVLRTFGAEKLPPPALHWLPNRWFSLFRGTKVPISEFMWKAANPSEAQSPVDVSSLTALRPPWRHPLWYSSYVLHFAKFLEMLRSKCVR